MTLKQKAISAYCLIGLIFSIYAWMFGPAKARGFFYNLGQGIVWPATMFPAVGAFVGGILIVAVIGGVLVFGKSSD